MFRHVLQYILNTRWAGGEEEGRGGEGVEFPPPLIHQLNSRAAGELMRFLTEKINRSLATARQLNHHIQLADQLQQLFHQLLWTVLTVFFLSCTTRNGLFHCHFKNFTATLLKARLKVLSIKVPIAKFPNHEIKVLVKKVFRPLATLVVESYCRSNFSAAAATARK